jgi:fermentation-respiration switch protein FrsA (DUF1100 family)
MLLHISILLVGALAILSGLLLVFENKLIYYPLRYPDFMEPGEGVTVRFRPYQTADGRTQYGSLVEPRRADGSVGESHSGGNGLPDGAPPRPRTYLVFNGNATVARDMEDYFQELAELTGCAFFQVDYRGYGFNEGKPAESGLVADALGAYDTLAREGWFEGGAGIIGCSLGGAAALAVAEQRPVERLILISTFTSIDDMARRLMPWPISRMNRNRWPNDRRLGEIVARPVAERPGEIVIFHGERDEVIPFAQGMRLAEIGGEAVRFVPLPEASHNDVFGHVFTELARMLE